MTSVAFGAADTIFGISAIDATAIATIALAVVGILAFLANVFLATMTARMAKATKDEAVATQQEAKATLDQATATKEQAQIANDTLQELRHSRELEWRPILVGTELQGGVAQGKAFRDLNLRNIGRGPALNSLFLREEAGIDGNRFLSCGPLNLGAGEGADVRALEQAEPPHPALFHRNEFPRELLICQDQFGNSFRFVPGFPAPEVWTREQDEQGFEAEPSWVKGMKELLWARQPQPEPDPESGHAFTRAIWIQGNYANIHSTVAMEAVPPSDLQPSDAMRAAVDAWVKEIRPNARARSMQLAMWQDPPGDNPYQNPWVAQLDPGPTISIRQPVGIRHRPPVAERGGQPEGDLIFPDLVGLWKAMLAEQVGIMKDLGVRRVRFGVTMIPYGSLVDQIRIVGLIFGDLPSPSQLVDVPAHEIRPWAFRSAAFDVDTSPAVELERAIRDLLRMFGYVAVDQLVASVNSQSRSSAPATA